MAVAAHTDPRLLALGEQLKPLWAECESLYLGCGALHEQAKAAAQAVHMASGASSPIGWGLNKAAQRQFDLVAGKNGHSQLWKRYNEVDNKVREIAEAILEIPSTDRVGDGIHAAAALALNIEECEGEVADVLWEMAERVGFERPEEAVQS